MILTVGSALASRASMLPPRACVMVLDDVRSRWDGRVAKLTW